MCLTLRKSRTDIAKRDIVCWKVVDPIEDSVPAQWIPKQRPETGAFMFNRVCKARKYEWSETIASGSSGEFLERKAKEVKRSKSVKRVLKEIDHLEIKRQDGLSTIEEGFHAFRTYKKAKKLNFKFYPCIVPKGSEYGLGIYDDLVSTQIIVFSNYWKFLKYLLLPWGR